MIPSHPSVPGWTRDDAPATSVEQYFAGDGGDCIVDLLVDGEPGRARLDARNQPFFVIGRSPECDLELPHPDVSHRHTSLQLVQGRVFCVDLLSRTGTLWGQSRRKSGWLLPGESLTIGPFNIAYPAAGGSTQLAIPATRPETNLMRSTEPLDFELSFLNGSGCPENRWSMNAPVVLVGKSKRCRLSINHPSVSRVHCSLTATPMGIWITDLLGRDGTWVNDERVTHRLLRAGDEVRVGKFRFQVDDNGRRLEDVSRSDALPSWTAPSHSPSNSGSLSERAVMSMFERFSQMQQQMFEMSHQQMMMMAQLVGNVHNNYADLAQQELSRIREIDLQLGELKAQIESRESPGIASDPAMGGVESDEPSDVIPLEAAATPRIPPLARGGEGGIAEGDHRDGESTVAPPEEIDADASDGPRRRRFSQGDVESHALLIERMASLKRERSSRWKNMLRLLTGSSR